MISVAEPFDSPVKPAISANNTVRFRIAPPERGSMPSLTSVFTRSAGIYLRNAASPPAMSAMAFDSFQFRSGARYAARTFSRSKRSTCLSSSTTIIRGVAITRRLARPKDAGGEDQNRRPTSNCRIVFSIGPRNSASGITVASVQPGKASGVSVTA